MSRAIAQAVRDGRISEDFLNQMVDRLIDLAKKSEKALGNETYDPEELTRWRVKLPGSAWCC